MSAIQPIGAPPDSFGGTMEQMYILIESAPMSGTMVVPSYCGVGFTIHSGANERLKTAEIRVNLGYDPNYYDPATPLPKDWQVDNGQGALGNLWDLALGGRKIMVTTLRQQMSHDWILFLGIIHKCEISWSGGTPGGSRAATLYATSIFFYADCEPGQCLLGQWRRSRGAECALAGLPGATHQDECLEVSALPVIFNPRGLGNCDSRPLRFEDGTSVYVFCDPKSPRATRWTWVKILRYVQWALMQQWPPQSGEMYDVARYSDTQRGVIDLANAGKWTTYKLKHLNLDDLIEPLIDIAEGLGADDSQRALLRAPPDMALDRFSGLEALAMVANMSGLCFYEANLADALGGPTVTSYLVWRARGRHSYPVRGRPIPLRGAAGITTPGSAAYQPWDSQPHMEPSPEPRPYPDPEQEEIYLYLASDRYFVVNASHAAEVDNATEGTIAFDESQTRNEVRADGDADQYEVTVELLPGWLPDPAHDVDPHNADAVNNAIANFVTDLYAERYILDRMAAGNRKTYGNVLRRWVLNEAGNYDANMYRRSYGRLGSSQAEWLPYRWRTDGRVHALEQRGDNGWSARRRRFLPTNSNWANDDDVDVPLGIMLQLSYDRGATWHFQPVRVAVEADECAIYIDENDLTKIYRDSENTISFAEAYVRDLLRVRVIANIEGDDALAAVSRMAESSKVGMILTEHVNRRDRFKRALRYKPGTQALAANSVLPSYGITEPGNRDDTPEITAYVERLRRELDMRKVVGSATIPYLLRDGVAPWRGYSIGDEIVGIITQDTHTYIDLRGNFDDNAPGCRVVGIEYAYSDDPPQHSTVLTLEAYAPDTLFYEGTAKATDLKETLASATAIVNGSM